MKDKTFKILELTILILFMLSLIMCIVTKYYEQSCCTQYHKVINPDTLSAKPQQDKEIKSLPQMRALELTE